MTRNSSIKVKPPSTVTCGKGISAKHLLKHGQQVPCSQAACPEPGIKSVSQPALLVAEEWLKEASSLFPRVKDHALVHFSLCSLTDAASVLATPRISGLRASPSSCASAQRREAARHGDVARGHRAVLAVFWGGNSNFPFLQYWQQF